MAGSLGSLSPQGPWTGKLRFPVAFRILAVWAGTALTVRLDMENGEEADKPAAAHTDQTPNCDPQVLLPVSSRESPEQVYPERQTHSLLPLTCCYAEILDRNKLEEEGGSAPPWWMGTG